MTYTVAGAGHYLIAEILQKGPGDLDVGLGGKCDRSPLKSEPRGLQSGWSQRLFTDYGRLLGPVVMQPKLN